LQPLFYRKNKDEYMNYLFVVMICFLFVGYSTNNKLDFRFDTTNKYKCSIRTSKSDSQITFSGIFKNEKNEPVKISYLFIVTKIGNSSNSNNSQSGEIFVKGNTETVLSKVTNNLLENDIYKIKLKIFENKNIILSDSLEFDNFKK